MEFPLLGMSNFKPLNCYKPSNGIWHLQIDLSIGDLLKINGTHALIPIPFSKIKKKTTPYTLIQIIITLR